MKKLACEIRGLEKAFGPNKVLRKIDLDLFPGEVTVLMGANGAGKSTLVKYYVEYTNQMEALLIYSVSYLDLKSQLMHLMKV